MEFLQPRYVRPITNQVTKACTFCQLRLVHAGSTRFANPVPIATVSGPPPPPAAPDENGREGRIERRKTQLDLLKQSLAQKSGSEQSQSPLQRRFWKDVLVKENEDGLQIFLDKRPVRTASKNILTVPKNKKHLAAAIALEWDLLVSAQQALKNHYIPLTSLTSRAVDIATADASSNPKTRNSIVEMVLRYLNTDTLLCWAPEQNLYTGKYERVVEGGETLREMQVRTARPIISYMTSYVWPGVEIQPVLAEDSILPVEQPQMTAEVVKGWVTGLSPWDLAGLERGVLATKSLLVASRLLVEWSESFKDLRDDGAAESRRFGIQDAAEACTVEVRWQTGMWGEVEDTHDVDREDLRRQLGSVVMLVNGGAV